MSQPLDPYFHLVAYPAVAAFVWYLTSKGFSKMTTLPPQDPQALVKADEAVMALAAVDPTPTPTPDLPDHEIDVIAMLSSPEVQREEIDSLEAKEALRVATIRASDELHSNPTLRKLAEVIDRARAGLDEVRPYLHLLPEPYATVAADVVEGLDLADDLLAKVNL